MATVCNIISYCGALYIGFNNCEQSYCTDVVGTVPPVRSRVSTDLESSVCFVENDFCKKKLFDDA